MAGQSVGQDGIVALGQTTVASRQRSIWACVRDRSSNANVEQDSILNLVRMPRPRHRMNIL